MMFECPHCKQHTVTAKQKYLAEKWVDIHCTACGGRSCMYPALVVVLWFFYTWDVMLFGYVAVAKTSVFYFLVMVGGWLFLDWIGLYIPLARMRPVPPAA